MGCQQVETSGKPVNPREWTQAPARRSLIQSLILLAVSGAPVCASPQVLFSLPVSRDQYTVSRSYAHPVHGLYVTGSIFYSNTASTSSSPASYLARFTHDGRLIWMASPLSEVYSPHGLTVDDSGTAYVAGRTTFYASYPSYGAVAVYSAAGIASHSRKLGGNRNSEAWDVAVSSNGDYTVTGQTEATDFPTTPGVIMPSIEQPNGFGNSSFAFITRFSRDHRIVFSTYLGGYKTNCSGGSSCIGVVGQTSGLAVRVDASGNSFVTGFTNATDFPVTIGSPVREGFAVKLNPAASRLLYSLHTPVANRGGEMHLGLTGEVTAAGNERQFGSNYFRGIVYRLSPSGDSFTHLSYLSDGLSEIRSLAADTQGNIWVSGGAVSTTFPDTEDSFLRGTNFLMKICFSGCTGFRSARLPQAMSDGALAITGDRIFVSGAAGPISALNFDGPTTAFYGLANGAAGAVKPSVSIGEIVSLFGTAIGPDQPQSAQPDSSGFYPSVLGGAEIRFDGFSAPLTYGQADQLNTVVPLALAGRSTSVMELYKNGVRVASREIQVHAAAPAFFQTAPVLGAPSVALNEDGSVNSRENPALRGGIVSLFGTGFGPVTPQPPDGRVTRDPYPRITMPLSARLFDQPLEILYAGYAPGLIAGTVQINVRLPDAGFGPSPAPVNSYTLAFSVDSYQTNAGVWIRY